MNDFLKLFHPSEYIGSVPEIDLGALKQRGIGALLMDLDNTLVPWQSSVINPDVADWVKKAHSHGMKMCIVSNTQSKRRLKKLAGDFDVAYTGGMKPRRGGFIAAMKALEVRPEQSAVIGDQIFTDILGGNRLGLYTILVRPIHHREFIGTKLSRLFEKIIFLTFKSRGIHTPAESAKQGTIGDGQPSDETGH